jgi:hypothetical protein
VSVLASGRQKDFNRKVRKESPPRTQKEFSGLGSSGLGSSDLGFGHSRAARMQSSISEKNLKTLSAQRNPAAGAEESF